MLLFFFCCILVVCFILPSCTVETGSLVSFADLRAFLWVSFSFACFILVLLFFKGGFALIQFGVERAAGLTSLFC